MSLRRLAGDGSLPSRSHPLPAASRSLAAANGSLPSVGRFRPAAPVDCRRGESAERATRKPAWACGDTRCGAFSTYRATCCFAFCHSEPKSAGHTHSSRWKNAHAMNPTEIPLKSPGSVTDLSAAEVESVERALIDASTRVPVLMFYTSAIVWLLLGTLLAFSATSRIKWQQVNVVFSVGP